MLRTGGNELQNARPRIDSWQVITIAVRKFLRLYYWYSSHG